MYLPKYTDTLGETFREIAFPDVEGSYLCYREYLRPDARIWETDELREFVRANYLNLNRYAEPRDPTDEDVDDIVVGNHAYGATFQFDDVTVDVLAYWDGDATLLFRVRRDADVLTTVVNHDAKKGHGWDRP